MRDLRFISWKEILEKALDESDPAKAAQLIHEADVAIYHRRQQLRDSAEHREELSAMSVAMEALRGTRRKLDVA